MVWIPTFLGLVIIVSFSISGVSASPQLPCEFYGAVTISGSPAPVGTVVTAYVNSVKQGSIVIKEPGKYGGVGTFDERLIVLAGENDFTGGAPTITFKIGDKTADIASPYTPGMSTELALSSGGGAPAVLSTSNGSSGSVQTMSAETVASPPVPVVVVPVVTSPVSAPVPVVTLAAAVVVTPAPQSSPAIMTVTPPVNQTPIMQNQSVPAIVAVAPTQIPPVVVSTPVPVAPPVVAVVNATAVPTVIPVVPVVTATLVPISSTPVPVNQTMGANVTNATISNNASVTVSFPSGQNVTQ